MKLNDLKPNNGATKNAKRVGRGIGSGKGKTCGVGQKGQKARSGVAINGYEGGQMPLYQRLPKRGFTNIFRKDYATVSLQRIQEAIDAKKLDAKNPIDQAALIAANVVNKSKHGLRVLGNGEITAKVTIKAEGATAGALKGVEKAGGKIEIAAKKEFPARKVKTNTEPKVRKNTKKASQK